MKPKPILGQTLYSLNVGNDSRYGEQKLKPVEVVSVGRKYFECSTDGQAWGATKYHIEDWSEKTNYSANSKLYESPQKWEDEKEIKRICEKIGHNFQHGWNQKKLDLDQLRRIELIIEEAK